MIEFRVVLTWDKLTVTWPGNSGVTPCRVAEEMGAAAAKQLGFLRLASSSFSSSENAMEWERT